MPFLLKLKTSNSQTDGGFTANMFTAQVKLLSCNSSIDGRLKGSQQPESRGVRNVSICPNFSRTAAIDVLFSINFAVVFDFMYFRFRPSKVNQ